MTFVIVGATEADASAIVRLLERCALPTAGVAENLRAFAVARIDGSVVGTCGVEIHATDGLLRSVAVDPATRDRGIATSLLEHAVARAEKNGLNALYLLTTTARPYFERRGFAVCPRDGAPAGIRDSWEFRTGCPDTAVFMRQQLRDV